MHLLSGDASISFSNIAWQSLGDIDVTSCVSKGPLAPCAYHAFTIDFFQCHKNWFLPLLQTCIMTCQNNTIRRQLVCLHLVYAECFSLLYQLHRYIFRIITPKNLIRNFIQWFVQKWLDQLLMPIVNNCTTYHVVECQWPISSITFFLLPRTNGQ